MLEKEMKFNVYLGLGSNIDDREYYLEEALKHINDLPDVDVLKTSSIYQTDPVGFTEQNKFLNMVVLISTNIEPQKLLTELLRIEKVLKRKRIIHWGPRTIDIDILIYSDLIINEKNLIIPHIRLYERAFVLIPLKEVYQETKQIDFFKYIDSSNDKKTVFLYKKRSEAN